MAFGVGGGGVQSLGFDELEVDVDGWDPNPIVISRLSVYKCLRRWQQGASFIIEPEPAPTPRLGYDALGLHRHDHDRVPWLTIRKPRGVPSVDGMPISVPG
jgi:hypothetical protein